MKGFLATLAIAFAFLAVADIVRRCTKSKNKEIKERLLPPYFKSDALRFNDEVMGKISQLVRAKAVANAIKDSREDIYTLDMERAFREVLKKVYSHLWECQAEGSCMVALNLDCLDDMLKNYEEEKFETP